MKASTKIQLAAGAAALNGIIALTLGTPSVALANPCAPLNLCYPFEACPTGVLTTYCQSRAPAGCTVTSVDCPVDTCDGGRGIGYEITCNFN